MEHSAIRSTYIKLPIVIKVFVLSVFCGRFTQVLLYLYDLKAIETKDAIFRHHTGEIKLNLTVDN